MSGKGDGEHKSWLSMGVILDSMLPGWEKCISTTWAMVAHVVPLCELEERAIFSGDADMSQSM